MAKILVDIREVVGSQESGNNYAFQASAIVMSDNTTTVQDKLTTLTGYFNSSGYANNAVKLATARTIDGVSFNGSANITHYGTCSTAAATAAKTVALTGFTLVRGAIITVRFSATNSAANPTLNVNNTGAKAIRYRNAAITAGYLAANRTYTFVYDGTYYQLVGDINVDTNTTYNTGTATTAGLTKLYTGTGNHTDGTMTQDAITDALGGKAATSHTHTGAQVTGLTANRVLLSNSSGAITVSAVTNTELGYLDGVKSSIQTQLNAKLPTSGGTVTGNLTVNGTLTVKGTFKIGNATITYDSSSKTITIA